MADKVLINLATGLEDGERVSVAFLVAGAALDRGHEVAMFLTKEAVRLTWSETSRPCAWLGWLWRASGGGRPWAATVGQTDIRGSGPHDWCPSGAASV